jgi:hypothetical protein
VRARPRFNKDEVDDDDENDVVVDDAIRCKVLGETDDDDFRNKTRAMADIYILRTSFGFGATNFAVVVSACLISFEKERREGKCTKTSSLLFSAAFAKVFRTIIIIFNNHHRSID